MRRICHISTGVPPEQQEQVLNLLAQELGYTPILEYGGLELTDEEQAKRLATRLHEAGFPASVHLRTEYDEEELDRAELLCLKPLECFDDMEIWKTPSETWYTSKGMRWGGRDDALTTPMYMDYAAARGRDLVPDPLSHELVISKRLKELWERHQISGVIYWPLIDANVDERPVSSAVEYYLIGRTHILPPLDPRVLVAPWKAAGEMPNFPVVSQLCYTRERLTKWCDVNRVLEELGPRVIPPIVVSQRLRQLLKEANVENIEYEPVCIGSENETVELSPERWAWYPDGEPIEILPFEAARKKYHVTKDP